MPVAGVTSGEGPFCTIECQTCTYVDIIDDVIRVVVIHKVVPMNGKINAGSNKREDKANEKLRFHWTAEVRSLLRPKTTRCERSAKKIIRRHRWSRIYSYG